MLVLVGKLLLLLVLESEGLWTGAGRGSGSPHPVWGVHCCRLHGGAVKCHTHRDAAAQSREALIVLWVWHFGGGRHLHRAISGNDRRAATQR